ncbi:arginyltransferase [Pleionea sediminis]|uniref:arginyltransferase n=1 Tax=Pleionea sediminis TaxID=2569479 RepID=UPI001185F2A8|nr:arginyltransferase [Pleionea sediminis]
MQQDPNDELLKLTFYATPSHRCSYLEDQQATTVFLDPEKIITQKLYTRLSETGFRRSGNHIYRPHCENCQACVPVRIPVKRFQPNRTQRRCLKKGEKFEFRAEAAEFSEKHYALYERYLRERHADGDMYPPTEQQYKDFLLSPWVSSKFLSFYDEEKLIACAVVDILDSGISAVYTYFDPDYSSYSLGRLAILRMIEEARKDSMDYVYLGYLVKDCQKMKYKSEYRPLDCFIGNRWVLLT